MSTLLKKDPSKAGKIIENLTRSLHTLFFGFTLMHDYRQIKGFIFMCLVTSAVPHQIHQQSVQKALTAWFWPFSQTETFLFVKSNIVTRTDFAGMFDHLRIKLITKIALLRVSVLVR